MANFGNQDDHEEIQSIKKRKILEMKCNVELRCLPSTTALNVFTCNMLAR